MILPPLGWNRSRNYLVKLPSGRWMPVHNRHDMQIEHIQDEIAAGEKDIFGKNPRPSLLRKVGQLTRELLHNPARHIQWCFHKTEIHNLTWGANVRLVRSQFREAIARLLSVMILNMDLATMLVARRDGKELSHYTLSWLAAQAGITHHSAKRVMRWLQKQGIVTTHGDEDRVYEQLPDGSYVGKAAPKCISTGIFDYFGLSDELKHQRDWASNRITEWKKQREREAAERSEAANAMRHENMLKELSRMTKGIKKAFSKAEDQAKPETPDTDSQHSVDSKWADLYKDVGWN